jgi:uncharacterized membrane protein YgdD (TMEM256/DUF423 family)
MTTLVTEKSKKTIFLLVFFGVIFFSGSIYLLATKTITGIDFKPLGILTPIGGALLILGWLVLLWNIFKDKK